MTLIGVVVVSVVVMAGLLIRQLRSFTAFLQAEHAAPIQVTLEDPDSVTPAGLPSLLDPGTKSLTIVVPAYNEEERLADTLTEALAYLQQRRDHQGPQFTYEVVVVDDGSRDGTVRQAQQQARHPAAPQPQPLRQQHNSQPANMTTTQDDLSDQVPIARTGTRQRHSSSGSGCTTTASQSTAT